jgi:hypothetical protein
MHDAVSSDTLHYGITRFLFMIFGVVLLLLVGSQNFTAHSPHD